MVFLLFNPPSSTSISFSFKLSSSFKPKKISLPASFPIRTAKTFPATDIIIDFGKHKGKMLGTLPSNYLRWVSKNLRAGNYERWAKLADQVLEDPVYKDRIEWEFAENVLSGNNAKGVTANDESSVSLLLEISERFGWDNEDKDGWSKVKFELLGTSNGGRLPRIGGNNGGNDNGGIREGKEGKKVRCEDEVLGEKRMERRERMRLNKERENTWNKKSWGGSGGGAGGDCAGGSVRLERNQGSGKDQTVKIFNRFPGREALLKKVISIPLLSCFPYIAMLSGVVLHLVINCAAILRNTLSVSLVTELFILLNGAVTWGGHTTLRIHRNTEKKQLY